jgi:hypothetical protein
MGDLQEQVWEVVSLSFPSTRIPDRVLIGCGTKGQVFCGASRSALARATKSCVFFCSEFRGYSSVGRASRSQRSGRVLNRNGLLWTELDRSGQEWTKIFSPGVTFGGDLRDSDA